MRHEHYRESPYADQLRHDNDDLRRLLMDNVEARRDRKYALDEVVTPPVDTIEGILLELKNLRREKW